MALAVSPELLSAVSAQLGIEEATVASWLATAKSFSAPVGPGNDDVSMFLASRFLERGTEFFGVVQPGVSEISVGRMSVEAAGITYDAEDIAEGGSVISHHAGFTG